MMKLLPSAWIFLAGSYVAAHPFAVTLTEIEVNADENRLEVSLKVYPEQLEQALRQVAGEKISIEEGVDIDVRIVEYLSTHFAILSPRKEDYGIPKTTKEIDEDYKQKLNWVGKEVTAKGVWLYFEVPHEGAIAGWRVRNTMLMELNSEQVNRINIRQANLFATCVLDRLTREEVILLRPKGKPARTGIEALP